MRHTSRRGAIAAVHGAVGAITQVGAWTESTSNVVGFDSTPLSGQLLVLRVLVTRTSAVPACATPAGWALRTSLDGISSTSHIKMFWFDRPADGTASDTPTLSITGGSQRVYSGRFTGQAASGYFDTATAGAFNITAGAQTFSDSALSPGASGLAFAVAGYRTNSQSITSWGGGFTSSFAPAATNAGGGIATQVTTSGSGITAAITVNNGGTTPITDLFTINYKAA